jgi:PAS domain-containing protein
MRDQHRDKRDLINELTDLRKQVADLKQAAADRRRLEDGLRREEELLRTLVDSAPVRLCLVAPSGEPLMASQSFARMLGYGSVGELVRLSRDLGLLLPDGDHPVAVEPDGTARIALRRKDGTDVTLPAMRAGGGEAPLAVAILEE